MQANIGGWRQPIVFVHTWGEAEPPHFVALADLLGPDQPLYAIQPPPPEDCSRINDVADWVAHMRARLDELPVAPPYRLAGWSFGGVVALELTRQLVTEGIEVASLDLIDSWRPHHWPRSMAGRLAYQFDRLARHLDHADRLSGPALRSYLLDLARRVPEHLRTAVQRQTRRARGQRVTRRHVGDRAQPASMPAVQRAIWVPYLKYEPRRSTTKARLFVSAASLERNGGDPSLGWSQWLTGGFEVVHLGGDHYSLWDAEHIGALAAHL